MDEEMVVKKEDIEVVKDTQYTIGYIDSLYSRCEVAVTDRASIMVVSRQDALIISQILLAYRNLLLSDFSTPITLFSAKDLRLENKQ